MRPVILFCAALLLAGCSHDTVESGLPVADDAVPIAFSGGMQEEMSTTRATSLSGVASQFTAFGYKDMSAGSQAVMNGYTVRWVEQAGTSTTNSSGWEYVDAVNGQTVKYWDHSALAYRFFGVAVPEANQSFDAHTAHKAQTTQDIINIPVDATDGDVVAATPYYSELWYSATFSHAPVTLLFLQPYSRVRFQFALPDGAAILLTGAKFHPADAGTKIHRKGTFTITYPLTGTDEAGTHERWTISATDASADLDGLTIADRWHPLLPTATPQGAYQMTVNVNGTERTAAVPAAYMDWKPGYEYTYRFKITDGGNIEFETLDAAFTPWVEVTKREHDVYNW